MNWRLTVVTGTLSVLLACVVLAQEEKPAAKGAGQEPQPVAKAVGYFEPVGAAELTAGTEQIKSLEIKQIVSHGTQVKKGQALVWFKTDDVDEQLEDAETALRLAELKQQEAMFTHQQFLKIQALDLALANRAKRDAQQTYDNFVKVDRDQRVASTGFNLKSSKASLENAMEELKQLEKMYQEDELTEESEEIVLKRAKRSVESAQFRLKVAEITASRSLEQVIPREQEQQDDTLARALLAFDKTRRGLELDRQRKEIEVAKGSKTFAKQKQDLDKMRADRKQMVLRAATDGVVYHGTLSRGKLGEKPSSLAAETTVTNRQVLVTLVNPRALQIRVDLPETALRHVKVGGKGVASPKAFPARKLEISVKSVSLIPMSNGKHDCVVNVRLDGNEPAIAAGMTCDVEFE
ncbi:MAG: HlyD family secretion protein [Planctomycetaceae bacterium]|nr:HlyD family secretion protein [Planctomycetaceae bacterium]